MAGRGVFQVGSGGQNHGDGMVHGVDGAGAVLKALEDEGGDGIIAGQGAPLGVEGEVGVDLVGLEVPGLGAIGISGPARNSWPARTGSAGFFSPDCPR